MRGGRLKGREPTLSTEGTSNLGGSMDISLRNITAVVGMGNKSLIWLIKVWRKKIIRMKLF